jgi:hypothetical protein
MREGPVEEDLIPAGIRTRLFTSITDPDWKERIVVAAQGKGTSGNPTRNQALLLDDSCFLTVLPQIKAIKPLIET